MRDQDHFATLSGDRNPMHLDPVFARRTAPGAPVVHGMHAVLWALDELARAGALERPVAALAVRFPHFIYVGAEAMLRVLDDDADGLRAEVRSGGLVAVTLDLTFGALGAPVSLADRTGSLPRLRVDPASFAAASARLGERRVETFLSLSYLVGMVCPGRDSIFSEFTLAFSPLTAEADDGVGLAYRRGRIDERFHLMEIDVAGAGASGTVRAFERPAPVAQRRFSAVEPLVREGEFAGTTALIVGGSRGLGAATARIIVAGGGHAVITYASGEADAREVAAELGAVHCSVLHYDVREDAARQLEPLHEAVDHLYYFASAHIHRQRAALFVPALFAEFCAFYVDGFARVWSALRERRTSGMRAFYPSSLAVSERPRNMTEYAMAKAAGEVLCADLNRFSPATPVLVERLPRVLTDQTATVIPVRSLDAVDVMLPVVRALHALSAPVKGIEPGADAERP